MRNIVKPQRSGGVVVGLTGDANSWLKGVARLVAGGIGRVSIIQYFTHKSLTTLTQLTALRARNDPNDIHSLPRTPRHLIPCDGTCSIA